jgi:hypothetical protein
VLAKLVWFLLIARENRTLPPDTGSFSWRYSHLKSFESTSTITGTMKENNKNNKRVEQIKQRLLELGGH